MKNQDLIQELREQSTWRLLALGLITYGIYFAYYIRRQTAKINSRQDKEQAISDRLIKVIFVLSYLSLALLFPYVYVDEGRPMEKISTVADLAIGIALIVWGVQARNRMNTICGIDGYSKAWFNGPASVLLTPLYFNYKINKLSAEFAKVNGAAGGRV